MSTKTDIDNALNVLAASLDNFKETAIYKSFLKEVSRFHHYSPNNISYLLQQLPTATKIAGAKKWETMNRRVKDGEIALEVLCPYWYKTGQLDAKGQPKRAMWYNLKRVVYDISQTEIIDPTKPDVANQPPLWQAKGESALYETIKDTIVTSGTMVVEVDVVSGHPGALGLYAPTLNVINIKNMNSAAMTQTLLHEWAHALTPRKKYSYDQEEVIVESCAYIVAQALGITAESETSSFVYITHWLKDDPNKFRSALGDIQRTAKQMMELLEGEQEPEA